MYANQAFILLFSWLVLTVLLLYAPHLYARPSLLDANSKQFSRNTDELTPEHWNSIGEQSLRDAQTQRSFNTRAKNVVLFLGDGLSIGTITAARILKGQLDNKPGEESQLAFEHFPHVSLIKTYNVDKQVPDSAGTGTAFMCGVKANMGTIGVNAKVKTSETNCSRIAENRVLSVLKRAIEAGKSAGVVTTTRITHATPAAGYAHIAYRDWESSVPSNVFGGCKDIALQLIEDEPGIDLSVILGGGRGRFIPTNQIDLNEVDYGLRADGKDLITQWWQQKRNITGIAPNEYAFVNTTAGLTSIDYDAIRYLFGLFNYDHMTYNTKRDTSPNGEPSIEQMTDAAIRVLRKNSNGFVLLVEGGRIDHAHHDNYGAQSLYETLAFERAIQSAMNLLPEEHNTIIVTGDHAHSFTINGYPNRGNNILSTADSDSHGVPYTTLLYGNGPGFLPHPRPDPTSEDTANLLYRQHSAVHLSSSAHSGEDVAVHSRGPMSHLFQGTQEQSYVAHVMSFAACIGNYRNEPHCATDSSSITTKSVSTFVWFTIIICLITY